MGQQKGKNTKSMTQISKTWCMDGRCDSSRRWAFTISVSSTTLQWATTRQQPLCLSACGRSTTPKLSTRRTCAGCRSRRRSAAALPRPWSRPWAGRPSGRGRWSTSRPTWSYDDISAATRCREVCTSGCCSWGAVETPSVWWCPTTSPTFCRTSRSATTRTSPGSLPHRTIFCESYSCDDDSRLVSAQINDWSRDQLLTILAIKNVTIKISINVRLPSTEYKLDHRSLQRTWIP